MAGFNHYPNCTCGWCVNKGREYINYTQLKDDINRQYASSLLDRNSVRSVTGCYVNPNARCPVCGQAVFFYSNEFGSRVYFDDLGHPWPKHPCTDNQKGLHRDPTRWPIKPVQRTNELSAELVSAARTLGMFSVATPSDDWQLLIVKHIDQAEGIVQAEFLNAQAGNMARFRCGAGVSTLEVGDYISKKENHISLLHHERLDPIIIEVEPPVQPKQPVAVSYRSRAELRKRRPTQASAAYDMTRAEVVHFHTTKVAVGKFCGRLEPVIRTYARTGIRKPREVTAQLNKDGHRTANGSLWTPRLVHVLLGLIFNRPGPR